MYVNPRSAHSKTVLSEPALSLPGVPAPRAAQARLFSALVSVPRVGKAEVQLVPTRAPRLAEALSVHAPVPAPRVGTEAPQPLSVPFPASRMRAAGTQSNPTPVLVSRVGMTGVQPPPLPVPAPRMRAARIQPDLPRGSAEALQPLASRSEGSEELACPTSSSPSYPLPHPPFHALA